MTFCHTCLSQDREVTPVDHRVKPTLLEWFNNNSNFKVNVNRFQLCWECYATILKLNKFKQQVLDAQVIRLEVRKKKSLKLHSLSQLCECINDNYDDEYVYEDSDSDITVTEKGASKRKKMSRSNSKTKHKKSDDDSNDSDDLDDSDDSDSDDPEPENFHNYYDGVKRETIDVKTLKIKEVVDLKEEPKLSMIPATTDKEIKQKPIDVYNAENEKHRQTKPTEDTSHVNESAKDADVKPGTSTMSDIKDKKETVKEVKPKVSLTSAMVTNKLKQEIIDAYEADIESQRQGEAKSSDANKDDDLNEEKHDKLIGDYECAISCTKKSLLAEHDQAHYLSYKCRQCDYKHDQINMIQMHVAKEHDLTQPAVLAGLDIVKCGSQIDKDDVIEIFPCGLCKNNFEGNAAYRAHVLSAHQDFADITYCADCDLQFNNLHAFELHVKTHRLFGQLAIDDANGSNDSLVRDMKNAHLKKNHNCARCNKAAAVHRLNLQGPRFRLNGNLCRSCLRKLKLQRIPKGFSDELSLKIHIKEFHPEK